MVSKHAPKTSSNKRDNIQKIHILRPSSERLDLKTHKTDYFIVLDYSLQRSVVP